MRSLSDDDCESHLMVQWLRPVDCHGLYSMHKLNLHGWYEIAVQ
jgi:hypothetical protein